MADECSLWMKMFVLASSLRDADWCCYTGA
ncbi:hypothetical protein Pint_22571 [Pistacia integerrima]|uniref:Uncharacterized protein n=1 Tax=Pistacia integerrima TaxID=434235 RepID=A0ACC0YJH5_9ROSI|nr:hypothetical protein Pint_22571 [Pistacia integerrima]